MRNTSIKARTENDADKYTVVHDLAGLIVRVVEAPIPLASIKAPEVNEEAIVQLLPSNVPRPFEQTLFGYERERRRVASLWQTERTIVVTGEPGAGKSTFAYLAASQLCVPGSVIWRVDCTDLESASVSFSELGEALSWRLTPGYRAIYDARLRLASADAPWCLVLDNLAGPEALDGMVPASGGKVLATSRVRRGWQGRAKPIPLGGLSKTAAIKLLQQRSGSSDREALRTLAEEFGGLPVALDHIGKVIEIDGAEAVVRRFSLRDNVAPLRDALPDSFGESLKDQLGRVQASNVRYRPASVLADITILGGGSVPRWVLDGRLPSGEIQGGPESIELADLISDEMSEAIQVLVAHGLIDADEREVRLHPVIASELEEIILSEDEPGAAFDRIAKLLYLVALTRDEAAVSFDDRHKVLAELARVSKRVVRAYRARDVNEADAPGAALEMMRYLRYALPELIQDGWWEAAVGCIDAYFGFNPEVIGPQDRQVLLAWRYAAIIVADRAAAVEALRLLRSAIDDADRVIDEGVGMPLWEYAVYGEVSLQGDDRALLAEIMQLCEPEVNSYLTASKKFRYMLMRSSISHDDDGTWRYQYSGDLNAPDARVARAMYWTVDAVAGLVNAAYSNDPKAALDALSALYRVSDIQLLERHMGTRRMLLDLLECTLAWKRDSLVVRCLLGGVLHLYAVVGYLQLLDGEVEGLIEVIGEPPQPESIDRWYSQF